MLRTITMPHPDDSGAFFLNPVLFKEDDDLSIVDAGMPGFLPKIQFTLSDKGYPFTGIRKIFVTHCDHDHVGGLKELMEALPGATVYASQITVDILTGKTPSPRFKSAVIDASRCRAVAPGDVVDGITAVDTEGHCAGHLSFFNAEDGVLVAGDALNADHGKLNGPNPKYTDDMATARAAAGRLLDLPIKKISCYHGGEVILRIKERLAAIAAGEE